ncbi:DUF1622 domain-containing protein [Treponema brennaborense]|uniref:DUF1622 domain-containing protein n=1 Tax=Treponema brennaborense (strain DSM 12168 / CIP 105900 / DD5/3) TaxID=906968 RepID=F4LPE9_TREBD|nr:DUF1622 domain-containing protein [Treponema brennaborense]AEE15960.1 protein of unknown function DUF1622 [Treponema brennaborense DSM 12168]
MRFLEELSTIISIISIFVVVYGTLIATGAFLKNEFFRLRGKYNIQRLRVLRADLGTYLLLGLELLIAADILKTIVEPGVQELGILAGVVVLRTVLSFFLNKEILEIDRERHEHPEIFEQI